MTDFTNCPIVPGRAYNGANGSKIAVEYGGGIYMLKFPPSGERKPTNLSYTNSCISEHLASSIFNLIGINAQKTELGTFSIKGKTKVVCACKDFATGSKRLFDFCSIKNTILDSDSNGSGTELEDVMDTIDKQQYVSPVELREHFWNVFILVCDDDAAFAGQLAEKIEAIVKPQMPRSTVDCATDAAQLRALPLAKYDLAFLDIDMGPLNGVDLARRLHELRPDMLLIFVTNYIEYSLQGYEVQAFRYLLKAEMPQKLERYVQQALTAYRKTRDTVRIFCDGEDVELQPQQILYAEMSARKVCLHLQGAERALLYTTATMADLADLLENHGFVRTHKSILVNMEHIRDLQSTRLYLRDGTELPVSSHTASAVRKIYTQWRSAKKWVIG